MRIKSIFLRGYKLFCDSGINSLEVEFNENIQFILGMNGSGKSSFLRQMSVNPPIRTLFDKSGYKSLVIEKGGIEFKLDSDFEKSTSPHLFFEGENEENLNVGRTTDVQKELIVEKLGITPLVDDLMMNRLNFPRWTPSKRKEFIMAHNPDNIGFVFNHLKDISSKIRSCKSNISRLQTRKIVLEQDLLSPETLEELILEKQSIENDLHIFQKYLMDIEIGLRTLSSDRSPLGFSITEILKEVKRLRYSLSDLSHVSRDDTIRQSDRDRIISDIASQNQMIIHYEKSLLDLSEYLRDLEIQYKELLPSDDLINLDETIERLERERDNFHVSKPPFELTKEELENRRIEWDYLREQLSIFDNCHVPLYSRKKRAHREQILENMKYRHSSIEMKLSDLKSRYEDLSKRHSISPSDIPDSPCSKDRCPLYAHFMGEYTSTEEKRQSILKSMERLERKDIRIQILLSGLSDYFRDSRVYNERVHWLINQAQNNPILHHVLRQMDVLDTLKRYPNSILMKLKDAYDHVDTWIRLKTIQSDLDMMYTLKKQKLSSQSKDIVSLVSDMENTKKSLYDLRRSIKDTSSQIADTCTHLSQIELFDNNKKRLFVLVDQYKKITKHLSEGYEDKALRFIKSTVESIRSDKLVRLSDIERTLRSQETLKSRYTEEVLLQIETIEKEKMDLEHIEKALIAIPRESTIPFLNDLFEQVNKIIESVWTIPLKIELLKEDDLLNYEFVVTGDNDTRRELSECSEGQTDMLALAINLSLRIVLDHLYIPLCLDEFGRTMDIKHKHNLIMLLNRLLDDRIISQVFMVSHHADIHEGFSRSETLVIREDNIMLPPKYNLHVKIN